MISLWLHSYWGSKYRWKGRQPSWQIQGKVLVRNIRKGQTSQIMNNDKKLSVPLDILFYRTNRPLRELGGKGGNEQERKYRIRGREGGGRGFLISCAGCAPRMSRERIGSLNLLLWCLRGGTQQKNSVGTRQSAQAKQDFTPGGVRQNRALFDNVQCVYFADNVRKDVKMNYISVKVRFVRGNTVRGQHL